jgi:hypothetical protein
MYFDQLFDTMDPENKKRIPIAEYNTLKITHKIKKIGIQPIEDTEGNLYDAKEAAEMEITCIDDIIKFMKILHASRSPKKGKRPIAD